MGSVFARDMKLLLPLVFAIGSAAALSASVTGDFYSLLTEAERRTAGIDRLSEEQRAALNVLANRWVEQKAESAIHDARQRAIAEVRAELSAEAPATPTAAEPVRTRLVGEFRGWETGTVFALANGESWAVDGPVAPRTFSARRSPVVELRPDAAGEWWLHLRSENAAVRVKRVR